MNKTRRVGYQLCEVHQMEYLQYCLGCSLGHPPHVDYQTAALREALAKVKQERDDARDMANSMSSDLTTVGERLTDQVETLTAERDELREALRSTTEGRICWCSQWVTGKGHTPQCLKIKTLLGAFQSLPGKII